MFTNTKKQTSVDLLADASRTADLCESALEVNVEAAVQDRINSAVEQCQRLGERVDGGGDVVAVLGPDVDQVDDEVRRPAADERTDDAQSYL